MTPHENSLSIDLSPARWIWFPSQRCLPNTFILFRREIVLDAAPVRCTGWLTADSRYLLTVNGQRVQWGPAPCDPRWQDVDPVDLTAYLKPGKNVIGVEVLYYGGGDGTWAMGSPGMICRLELESNGTVEQILSGDSWLAYLDRAHRPGMHKRWFVRALQEEFDANLHPYGWDTPSFEVDESWLPAQVLPGAAHLPAIFAGGPEYLLISDLDFDHTAAVMSTGLEGFGLHKRSIPLMREWIVAAKGLREEGRVQWLRSPDDWFESRVPGSFRVERATIATRDGEDWILPATAQKPEGIFVTFEFPEQIVGFPRFTIEAPAGTIVEMMTQEAHDPTNGPAWLDTHFYQWSRFICREGTNQFETFDFESFRWLQLHIRNASRPVRIRAVGARRRVYAWENQPQILCSEPALQRLFDASVNTLHNSAQETVVDGMGRERQQYSGDCGHQLQAVRYAFGETRQSARFLRTFSQGMTFDGYFLDTWPAYDRLARIMQRQMGTTIWGPILDHGVQFVFDCWNYSLETGDLDALRDPYPRLLKFAAYLQNLVRADGLLPVEKIGVPSVWLDHDAYTQQRHKQCAFNLNTAAMFRHALAPLVRTFGDDALADRFDAFGQQLLATTTGRFWDAQSGLFVTNRPWLAEEGSIRLCDRSLATSIIFDQCPGGDTAAAVQALATCPPEMGLSYPANAGWRYHALAKAQRADVIVTDLRTRWANMDSVLDNNALQENWKAKPDSMDQFSHCALAPIYILMTELLGIKPLEPAFKRYEIRPQLADLGELDVTAHTVQGAIRFQAEPQGNGYRITIHTPARGEGIWVAGDETTRLEPGKSFTFFLERKAG